MRIASSFESWRAAARGLLQERVEPAEICWDDGVEELLLPGLMPLWLPPQAARVTLPRRFVTMASRVAAHRERTRWDLLYRTAFRITYENRDLLELIIDDDVRRLHELERAVQRDVHKMHAFVRFRSVGERFVAWYRPDHSILPLAAPFFAERFSTMRWSILTPDLSAHWDGSEITWAPGAPRSEAPTEDELEELWRTYYASVFNPARTNLAKMRADMPTRFWREMPELRDVTRLISAAPARVDSMLEGQRSAVTAAPFVPEASDIEVLRSAADACRGCDLYRSATHTVFGEGPPDARVVLVGEQPGDHEDLQARPFVGPAGEVLDRALEEAGLDRRELYVTNAVKHFAHIERGKARIHRTPKMIEVAACKPWLDAELNALQSPLVVCLGATAARALLGGRVRILRDHGQFYTTRDGREVLPTIHPSAVLRAEPSMQSQYYGMLVTDLRHVAARLQ